MNAGGEGHATRPPCRTEAALTTALSSNSVVTIAAKKIDDTLALSGGEGGGLPGERAGRIEN